MKEKKKTKSSTEMVAKVNVLKRGTREEGYG